jgi:uncharacterized beta-barrel protein YwiB (DUF1934 family)
MQNMGSAPSNITTRVFSLPYIFAIIYPWTSISVCLGGLAMNKNVIMKILGEQTENGKTNRLELITEGRYYDRDGALCLEYQESEISGMEGVTTTISVQGKMVSLIRRGQANSHMVFEPGKKCIHQYDTPMGTMEMGIYPLRVDVDLGEEEGRVGLSYQLDIDGRFTSSNSISVTYRTVH